MVLSIEENTLTSATGGICARGEGAWRWRVVIYPDNCTYLSVNRQNICAGGGGVAAAVRNTQTRADTSVGRELLSSQNGGPWDKTT